MLLIEVLAGLTVLGACVSGGMDGALSYDQDRVDLVNMFFSAYLCGPLFFPSMTPLNTRLYIAYWYKAFSLVSKICGGGGGGLPHHVHLQLPCRCRTNVIVLQGRKMWNNKDSDAAMKFLEATPQWFGTWNGKESALQV